MLEISYHSTKELPFTDKQEWWLMHRIDVFVEQRLYDEVNQ